MRQGSRAFVLAAALGFVWPTLATADVRYAEPAGDGPEATCPAANPCDLTNAVEGPSAADGDEVVVLPGRHQLPGELPDDGWVGSNPLHINRGLDVHGSPGAPPTVVESPIGGPVIVNDPIATLSDVAVEGMVGLETGVAERLIVKRSGGYACLFLRSDAPSDPQPLIRDSVCFTDPDSSVIGGGVGVRLFGSPPTSVTGRLVNVTAIGRRAILVAAEQGSSATVVGTNVIAVGSEDGADVEAFTGTDGVAATVSLTNSNYESVTTIGAGVAVTPPGTGSNQTAAPILASPSIGDARQVTGSPTIDAGSVAPLLGSFDFEGQARIQGPAPDTGADEGSIGAAFALTAPTRRELRDLAVTLRCQIALCGFEIAGLVKVKGGKSGRPGSPRRGRRRFELQPRSLTLAAGERTKVKLKPFPSERQELGKLIASGAKAAAVIDVDTGDGGVSDQARVKIKRS